MKKNLKRNKSGQFTRYNSEYSFVNLSTYTSPQIVEVNNRDWVDYGADNNYFQYLIDRYNGSPTNNAAINGISQAIYGKGLNATDSNRKPDEYAQMISLFKKEVVRKLCYDLKLMGQCAVQVIYNKGRSKIVKLEHIPVETLRAEKANEDGDIAAYYYYKDWSKLKPNEVPKRIPAYGMSKEPIEIYYIKPYKAGFYYYAPVDYQGGLQYAELEEEISNYHLNNIMNGLAPSMLINFNNGTPNQEERQLLEQKIAQKFSGSSNAGKFILAFNDNKEAAADITPVQLSDAHQQYQFLSEESTKKIMVAHRVVSPMLLGIKDQSGLGNNAEEIKTASLLMDNTVIRPFQELLMDCFDHLLSYNDIALNLYFTTLQPLEFTEVDSKVQDEEDIEEETGYEFKEESEVPKLSDEQGDAMLQHLKGEEIDDEWEIVDSRDVSDDNVSDEEWAEASIVNKETTLSKIKKLVGLADEITSKKKGSAWSTLDSLNYKIRYHYYKKSSAGSIQKVYDPVTKKMKRKTSYETRKFCENMMSKSRSGIVWRIEDIDKASREGINGQFAKSGKSSYDLFKYKGGCYCRHAWKQVLFKRKKGAEISEQLKNYRKVGTIPKTFKRNPWGSKDALKATFDLLNHGSLKYKY